MAGPRLDVSVRAERLWTQLWVAPVVGAATAVLVAAGTLLLDERLDLDGGPVPLFVGTADSARTFLSVVVTSVTTLLALVFTVIAVVIQLASAQYSPRILRTLVKDKPTHVTIGIFVGTITYALICLQFVDRTRDVGDADSFTSIAVSLGLVLAVVAIGTFAAYSNHIVHAVRVENIIGLAAGVALELVDQEHPDRLDDPDRPRRPTAERPELGVPDQIIRADRAGALVGFDAEALVDVARDPGAVLVLVPRLGSFVRTGGPLLEVHGTDDDLDLVRHLALEAERTTGRDLSYAMRQLVDIAARALSPGDHDPTTAVQALDQVHEILAELVGRRIENGVFCDDDGDVRLVTTPTTWEAYVALALDEVTRLGGSSAQVTRRLLELLEDLHGLAPDDRRGVLERQHLLALNAAEAGAPSDDDRGRASQPDRQGLGL